MKIAYLCEPQYGGTFTFFRRLRPALREHGIDFCCIPPLSAERFPGTPFADEEGLDLVTFPEDDPQEATRILIGHLTAQSYNAVMILPGTDVVCTNIVRYLPSHIRALARVPMFTRGAYGPAVALAPHLDLIIGVCDRIIDDLRDRYRASPKQLKAIYNGIDIPDFLPERSIRKVDDPFHLIFTGRLVNSHKGIFMLPRILQKLRAQGIDARMLIVGAGPDQDKLKSQIDRTGLGTVVRFYGAQPYHQLQHLLRQADVFVMPSRYEGCPNALLEAMSAGCACVASRLKGATDQIIKDGESGWLADVDRVHQFAACCRKLAENPEDAAIMGQSARQRVIDRFAVNKTAERYAAALRGVQRASDERIPPLDIDQYSVPATLGPTWRRYIPDPIKNLLRVGLERLGVSS